MKKYRGVLFVALVLLGIILVVQIRSVTELGSDTAPSARELAITLEAERENNRLLRQTLQDLELDLSNRLRRIGENMGDDTLNDLIAAREHALFRAGLSAVSGSGIAITLNDAAAVGDMGVEAYIIHDSDVYSLLNELRVSGAEAISINGERILGMTKTVCAGPTILINNSRHPAPFEFKAIGDPQRLYEALDNSVAVNILRLYDIRVDIRIEQEIVINKYRIYDAPEVLVSKLEVVVQ